MAQEQMDVTGFETQISTMGHVGRKDENQSHWRKETNI